MYDCRPRHNGQYMLLRNGNYINQQGCNRYTDYCNWVANKFHALQLMATQTTHRTMPGYQYQYIWLQVQTQLPIYAINERKLYQPIILQHIYWVVQWNGKLSCMHFILWPLSHHIGICKATNINIYGLRSRRNAQHMLLRNGNDINKSAVYILSPAQEWQMMFCFTMLGYPYQYIWLQLQTRWPANTIKEMTLTNNSAAYVLSSEGKTSSQACEILQSCNVNNT